MKDADFTTFSSLMAETASMYAASAALTPSRLTMMFRALESFDIDAVRAALNAHMRHPTECRFFPLPGQLIAHMAAADGRPGPDEAWAHACKAESEWVSVVWTQEIAQAWEVSRHVLPDAVGARKAFIEAYGHAVDAARAARRPVVWTLLEGRDPRRRAEALELAWAQGLIVDAPEHLLLEASPSTPSALALAGPVAADQPPSRAKVAGLARLQELRARFAAPAEPVSLDAAAREETLRLQQQQLERVARYGLVQRAHDPGPLPMPLRYQIEQTAGPAAA